MFKLKRKVKQKALHGLMAMAFAVSSFLFPLTSFPGPPTTVQAASGDSGGAVERIYGSDRYETAAKIAQAGWEGTSEFAVLSAGMDKNLVDALAAAPLAKLKKAPILLTQGDVLNSHAEAELKRLNVKTVYVTTGSKVITPKVLDRLGQLGVNVVSLGGNDRFETAVNIAKQLGNYNELVVATAKSNADALSVAAIAASKGMPILLSNPEGIPDQVKSYISSVKGNITQTYVLGGKGVLSDNVKNALPNSVRIGGTDRYGTNIEILKTFANELKVSAVYLANGEDRHLVDALAGAPLAAQTAAPVLLSGKDLPSASKEFAKLNLGSQIVAFGGENVVPKAVAELLSRVEVYSEAGAIIGSSDASKPKSIANAVKINGNDITLKNAQVAYNVSIQGDNVLLENVSIKGTLFVDPGEKGTTNLNNVKASKIVVLSGAKDSIHLNNTEAGTLVISSSSEVRVESTGSTRVGNTVVTAYAILDASGGSLGQVEVMSIDGQAPVVTFRGTFDQPIVVNGEATLRADANASIASVEIAPKKTGQKVTLDGKFDSVVVNREAQVDLTADSTVASMVTNAKVALNVPTGASIVALDKKGNDVALTGTGSVGGTTQPGTGNGAGAGNDTGGGTGGYTIPVTGISVDPTTMTLTAGGETGKITATITPANATNKSVTWSSSNTGVATVSSSGVVTPVAAGTATITATLVADNTKKASTLVTVEKLEEGFVVTSSVFENGGAIPVNYTMYGENSVLPLQWNNVEGATNYALLMYDVNTIDPEYGPFIHWAVTGISNLSDILSGATQYTNWFGELGYGGPMPPAGEAHTYKIIVYALNGSVSLADDESGIEMAEFEQALSGKIIKSAELTGTYAVDAISASWVPTGKVEKRNSYDYDGIFKEYQLKAGAETISIAADNVELIMIDGFPITPDTETSLWIPIDMDPDIYSILVSTHDKQIYEAALDWQGVQEVEVTFNGPTPAADVFIPAETEWDSDGIDFSQVGVENLIDLSKLEDSEYAITLSLDGIELNAENIAKVFRVYEDDTIIEPAISDEFVENAQYVTTKWRTGYVTIYYVLTDGTILSTEFYIEEPLIKNLNLVDSNGVFGVIKGTLSWDAPTIATGVDGYNIYFMDYQSSTIGEPIGTVAKETKSLTISTDLEVPESAATIGVVCYKMTEEGQVEYDTFVELNLQTADNSANTLPPTISDVSDEDSNAGIDGRDFTVTWEPSNWAYETLKYEIYIATTGSAITAETLGDYTPIATITSITDSGSITWTGESGQDLDSEGEVFASGDYNVWVAEHSQGWKWLSNPITFKATSDSEPLTINWASTYDYDWDGVLDQYLIFTNRAIDDATLDPSKFLIDGVAAVDYDTSVTENDKSFFILFNQNGHGTDALPTLTVLAGAFKDLSGMDNSPLNADDSVEHDGARPVLEDVIAYASTTSSAIQLTFSEDLSDSPIPSPDSFTLGGEDAGGRTVSGVSISGEVVSLTLTGDPLNVGDSITISYIGKDPKLQDDFENTVLDFPYSEAFPEVAINVVPAP